MYAFHIIYIIGSILFSRYYTMDTTTTLEDKVLYTIRLVLFSYVIVSPIFCGHHIVERELNIKYV